MKPGVVWSRSLLRCCLLAFVLILGLGSSVAGQGFPQAPDTQSSMGTRSGLDLTPSDPFGMSGSAAGQPRGSDSVFLSSKMFGDILPLIPNLEIGYLYTFGNSATNSRLTLDYVLPIEIGHNGAVFGEAHGEFTNFLKTVTGSTGFKERSDVCVGGGYRRILHDDLFLGANAFYDASKLGGRWYGSSGLGLEMAFLLPGNDMLDLNFNYYGNIFQGRNSIVNAFRNGTGNFDMEAGYSHELYDEGPDLRLKVTGYQFDAGTTVYGWNAGAEVSTRDGLFTVRADTGKDRFNGTYHRVGGFVNVGLELERLLRGESPFVPPEPVFRSPRNLRRMLTRKVVRRFFQPAAVVGSVRKGYRTIEVTAPIGGEAPLHVTFLSSYWLHLALATTPQFWADAHLSETVPSPLIDPAGTGTVVVLLENSAACVDVRVEISFRGSNGLYHTLSLSEPQDFGPGQATFTIPINVADQAVLAGWGTGVSHVQVEVYRPWTGAVWFGVQQSNLIVRFNE